MGAVRLRGVSLVHADGTRALDGIDLSVPDGELLVLIGPSGSGKSTLLRVVAGLDRPTEGTVAIDDLDVTSVHPSGRDVGMIFQDYALIPQRDAAGNIGFPLEVRHMAEAERDSAVVEESKRVGLSRGLLHRRPKELSAGHQQLVAAGRAMVRRPKVLLADEPLSHLDTEHRHRLRLELVRLHRELGTTTIYATNDPTEAMSVGDRVAVLREGNIVQVGQPLQVYREPSDLFVAQFTGSTPVNTLSAVVEGRPEAPVLVIGGDRIALPHPAPVAAGTPVVVGIRPEHLTLAVPGTPFTRCLHGRVERVELVGPHALVHVRCENAQVLARVPASASIAPGNDVELAVTEPPHLRLYDPSTGKSLE